MKFDKNLRKQQLSKNVSVYSPHGSDWSNSLSHVSQVSANGDKHGPLDRCLNPWLQSQLLHWPHWFENSLQVSSFRVPPHSLQGSVAQTRDRTADWSSQKQAQSDHSSNRLQVSTPNKLDEQSSHVEGSGDSQVRVRSRVLREQSQP